MQWNGRALEQPKAYTGKNYFLNKANEARTRSGARLFLPYENVYRKKLFRLNFCVYIAGPFVGAA